MLATARSTHYPRLVARRIAVRSLATNSAETSSPHPPPPPAKPPGSSASTNDPSSSPQGPKGTRSRTGALFHPAPRTGTARAPPPFLPYLSPSFGRNQQLAVPDEKRALLESIVGSFQAPVRYAFAYGSGVFPQAGYENKAQPMLDFVLAVTHPDHWHSINMTQNPSHYPAYTRVLGSNFVAKVQRTGPGVWFNAFVPTHGVVGLLHPWCRHFTELCPNRPSSMASPPSTTSAPISSTGAPSTSPGACTSPSASSGTTRA